MAIRGIDAQHRRTCSAKDERCIPISRGPDPRVCETWSRVWHTFFIRSGAPESRLSAAPSFKSRAIPVNTGAPPASGCHDDCCRLTLGVG